MGCLLYNLFCHIYAQAQGAAPSHTQKILETYGRIPSQRHHYATVGNAKFWKDAFGMHNNSWSIGIFYLNEVKEFRCAMSYNDIVLFPERK